MSSELKTKLCGQLPTLLSIQHQLTSVTACLNGAAKITGLLLYPCSLDLAPQSKEQRVNALYSWIRSERQGMSAKQRLSATRVGNVVIRQGYRQKESEEARSCIKFYNVYPIGGSKFVH
ncbi:hypothetical protein GQX74_009747 [Glossina fuscipes]|nr:hypothetical protein GQX74_009747 [Glossina fuscipes]